ncbi:glycoside hydrolase [Nocardia tengchongensis]|uniref:hypothetical protein n=1 Tax=Nocardia tengchongensis TaxID=2055889 RepID=UPI0036CC310A
MRTNPELADQSLGMLAGSVTHRADAITAGGADPELRDFSIERDLRDTVPAVREALAANPAMTVMANPWTPPAWMKTDDSLVTTTGPFGHLKPEYYDAFARYLVKFVQAYRDQGIDIDYLGVQNEPMTPLALVVGIPESYLDPIQSSFTPAPNRSPRPPPAPAPPPRSRARGVASKRSPSRTPTMAGFSWSPHTMAPDHTFTLTESGRRAIYTLPAGATATLVWQPVS